MAIPFGSDIDLKNNKIKNAKVDTPSEAEDITNKDYVDNKVLDGSTVPVGSVIGFEGEDIPDGFEIIELEEDTPTEDTTESEPKVLTSADNVNRVFDEGRYLCYYDDLPSNLPENSTGVLEVIRSGQIVDHCIQKYYIEESQTTYERHISEELGYWHKIVKSNMFAVLTGTFTTPAANDETVTAYIEISYPEGYTKDNCAAISTMSHSATRSDYWSTTLYSQDSLSIILGNGDLATILKPDVIRIMINKAATTIASTTITYRVVLMRIDI